MFCRKVEMIAKIANVDCVDVRHYFNNFPLKKEVEERIKRAVMRASKAFLC